MGGAPWGGWSALLGCALVACQPTARAGDGHHHRPAEPQLAFAEPGSAREGRQPTIAIVLDDMGNSLSLGEAALALPGAVTYSFLPHTSHARPLAERVHASGREVMLHLPMDSFAGSPLGKGGVRAGMTADEVRAVLRHDLDAVPYVSGFNNHMGSHATRERSLMGALMQEASRTGGLFFVDSRTTTETVAQQAAADHGLPNTRRDVFLDNERDEAAIRRQFHELLGRAQERGFALGIGHPHPETLRVLREELGHLDGRGVRLVPASRLIGMQKENRPWHAPSSPSLKVARSSKP